jgi:heavy metal sensor kinase
MNLSIRLRLTLWYVVVLTVILLIFVAGVYAFVATEERRAVDRILRERAESFSRAYSSEVSEEANAALEVAGDYSRGEGDVFVYTSKGQLLVRSPVRLLHLPDARSVPSVRDAIARAFTGRRAIVTTGEVRCIVEPFGGQYVFVSTESLAGRHDALRRLRQAFLVLIPVALLIAALGGYFLASRSLAPVARITEDASRIEAENLSDRITVRNSNDELGRLASVLNALLQRLERSFQQQKQLLADTSHELRTPVTIIRSEAEVTLSRERDSEEYRDALEVIRSESSHLSNLIEGVLLLARADARQSGIQLDRIQLATVIEESVQVLQRVAQSRQITLTCSTDGPMPTRGNAELLRRMFLNLLDNSMKFTDSGGRVRLDSHRAGPHYMITVTDTGRGIPIDAQERIFDRFFRADAVRGRGVDRDSASGSGLGLPIARWIARAHGGDLRLIRSTPSGSTFEAVLPITGSGEES